MRMEEEMEEKVVEKMVEEVGGGGDGEWRGVAGQGKAWAAVCWL